MNHIEIYNQTQICIEHIRKRINEEKIHYWCANQRTIEKSNKLWEIYLKKFKNEAFKLIETSLSKPYVIYCVNKYYSF